MPEHLNTRERGEPIYQRGRSASHPGSYVFRIYSTSFRAVKPQVR